MKFFIKKLGCPKNDVDGDFISGRLIDAGHQITDQADEAESVIINTCGFILPAKEESIQEILFYEKTKQQGKIARLYVTGCLSQRYGEKLLRDIRGIDGIFGLGELEALAGAMADGVSSRAKILINPAPDFSNLAGTRRYLESGYCYEYLKISDGCDRYCGYCAIPYIRGRYRSRSIENIISEAQFLAGAGRKELILVSQEGTGYGRDFKDGTNIISLLQRLEQVAGIEWIRLMYLYPEAVTDELIQYLSFSPKTLGYFDVPLQHISDIILSKMNRRINRARIEEILQKIRDASPDNIIRTTFIAGLPGETDTEFSELRDFIADFEFERLGVFKYSQEEGTPAARFAEQVPEKVKDERLDELMTLQQEIAFRKNIALIDTIQKVIIDKAEPDSLAVGRTKGDCPDIDQNVLVRDAKVKTGDILDAKIIMTEGYDLIATTEIGPR